MTKREPIVINGQPIGRIKASWLLFKETWTFLKADKEMVWIPVITSAINLVLFGVLVAIFVLVVMGGDFTLSKEGEPMSPIEIAFLFACYVVGAFTLALSQSGITHTVFTRARGGDATLSESLKVAFSNWQTLLLWSVITSTVGIVLRMIAERSKLLGKIVVTMFGVAWSVLTYFVVPAIVIDKNSAFSAIGKSKRVFQATWGETLVSNFTLGLTFFLAHLLAALAALGLLIFAAVLNVPVLVTVVIVAYIIWFILAALVQASLVGVLKTLLYIYATEGAAPVQFNQELLEKMLVRSSGSPISFAPAQANTVV